MSTYVQPARPFPYGAILADTPIDPEEPVATIVNIPRDIINVALRQLEEWFVLGPLQNKDGAGRPIYLYRTMEPNPDNEPGATRGPLWYLFDIYAGEMARKQLAGRADWAQMSNEAMARTIDTIRREQGLVDPIDPVDPRPITGPIALIGREFRPRLRFASCLSALKPGHEYRPALDELAALGFNGVRVFCGVLPWAGQALRHVYDRLPAFLDEARARGLYASLSYHTDAGTGYDLDAHTDELERLTAGRDHLLKEVANEATHPTQGGRLSEQRCRELRARMTGAVGLSCGANDESHDYLDGHWVPKHLDRGRDKWNQVRRVRELEAMSAATGKPVHNQEPIGADETSRPGARESDPAIFFTMGALNRLFEVGGCFHSEDGLHARPLQPNQRRCAELFVQGSTIWPVDGPRLTYKNSNVNGGWDDSPVQSHNLNGCVRAYSGVVGNEGFTCALGITGDPGVRFGARWREAGVLAQYPGVTVWRVQR